MLIKLTEDEHGMLWRHEDTAKLLTALHCAPDSLLFYCSEVEFEVFIDTCCHLLLFGGLMSNGEWNEDGRLLDGLIDRTYEGPCLL